MPLVNEGEPPTALARHQIARVGNEAQKDPTLAVRLVVDLATAVWDGNKVRPIKSSAVLYGDRESPRGVEMVAISPENRGKPYRFAYCCDMSQDVGGVLRGWSGLVKVDVVSGKHATWQAQQRRSLVGDPEFVPAPTRRGEDDGWILTHVFDPVATLSTVAVVDAKTMTLVASVRLPLPLPMGFHTSWTPSML